jgi:hypothetical protein
MRRFVTLVAILFVGASSLSPLLACGDKFLMVGRGAKFQRAYASVHPGKVLIFARPSKTDKAAIRDPQLHKQLRQAGHTVSVIEDWALLEQAIKTVPVDLVLVDVAEASRMKPLVASTPKAPNTLYVAFPGASKAVIEDEQCRLKSSDKPLKYLDEVENAMKARTKQAKG